MTPIGLSWVISAGSVIWGEGHDRAFKMPSVCVFPERACFPRVAVPLPAALLGAGYEEIKATADIT